MAKCGAEPVPTSCLTLTASSLAPDFQLVPPPPFEAPLHSFQNLTPALPSAWHGLLQASAQLFALVSTPAGPHRELLSPDENRCPSELDRVLLFVA